MAKPKQAVKAPVSLATATPCKLDETATPEPSIPEQTGHDSLPEVEQEIRYVHTGPKGSVVTKGGEVLSIDTKNTDPVSVSELTRESYALRMTLENVVNRMMYRKFFSEERVSFCDRPSENIEDVKLYPVVVSPELTVWMDEHSSLNLDSNGECDGFYSRVQDELNKTKRVLVLINSCVELGVVKVHDQSSYNTSVLINCTGKVSSIASSVVAADTHHNRAELEVGSMINSDITFRGWKLKCDRLDTVDISGSTVTVNGIIESSAIEDSHICGDSYSSMVSTNVRNSTLYVKSFHLGNRHGNDVWAPRINIDREAFYLNDHSIEIRRGFEFDYIGRGYRCNGLMFVPLRNTGDGITKFLLAAPNKEGRDYSSPEAMIDWDMSRDELRKNVTALLFPELKSDNPLAGVGTLEGSIINEAVSVLYNRLRIIKQTRLASAL
ncbi:hypothetical protein [Vibrio phage phiKT1019]|nr:hypothetical protein [Vibrio phage phiKT1019]